jgi:hypothetical protein
MSFGQAIWGLSITFAHLQMVRTFFKLAGNLSPPACVTTLKSIPMLEQMAVVERSRKPGKSVKENFSANAAYLKKVFRG